MNDDVILSGKPALAPILVIWPTTAFVFALIFYFMAAAFKSPFITTIYTVVALLFIAACVFRLLVDLWERETTLYTLTTRDVIKEWGILHRDEKTIPLENVQVVTVRQPLVGRWLDYGTVVVQAASFGAMRLVSVPRPLEWKRTILESGPVKANRGGSLQTRERSSSR